jgi:hypothetical protein
MFGALALRRPQSTQKRTRQPVPWLPPTTPARALNSGLPGMCSLHANSARDAVTKLTTLPLLAGEYVSHRSTSPTTKNTDARIPARSPSLAPGRRSASSATLLNDGVRRWTR